MQCSLLESPAAEDAPGAAGAPGVSEAAGAGRQVDGAEAFAQELVDDDGEVWIG